MIQLQKTCSRCLSLAFAMAFLGTATMHAEKMAVVHLADGSSVSCPLTDNPVIAFKEGSMLFETPAGNHMWALKSVEDVAFRESGSVKTLDTTGATIRVIAPGIVEISGVAAGTRARVYDMDGKTAASFRAGSDNRIHADFSHLNSGIYMLNVAGTSITIKTNIP